MNKLTAFFAASALVASSTFAFAGGPIVIAEEVQPMVVIATPSSGNLGPAIGAGLGLLILCALACGGDSDTNTNTNTNNPA